MDDETAGARDESGYGASAPGSDAAAPPPAVTIPPRVDSPSQSITFSAARSDGTVAPPAWRSLRADAPPRRRGIVRTTARWTGAAVSTVTLFVSLAVAAAYIADLTHAGQDVAGALTAIFVSLGIGIVFGMWLMFVSMKTYSKVVFALLSLVLITSGFFMLVFAPVVRQMNTEDLAEYQAFSDLLWFGTLSVVLGIVLGAMCLRWALRPHAIRRIARWARLLGSAYGVMLGISGVFGILALFFLINGEAKYTNSGAEQSVVEQAIAFAAIAMWSFVPGLILTYQGISASMGEGSSEFRPPVAAYGFVMFAGVLLVGQVNMRSADPIAAPMPLLHVAAAALPGLTFAAMAGRGSVLRGAPVRWVSWRQLTLAIAISMALATLIATYVESLGSIGGVVLLLVHSGAFEHAQDWDGIQDKIRDADFILSRNEQFWAGLITASLLAPLSEEFGKGLSVRFMLRRTMTRGQAFMLGAFAGAGFGFLEAMLYGLNGISSDLGGWWQIMLLRGGSTSLHVFCTGLTGLGWWYWTVARRSRLALGLFGLAVLFHASWNAAFTLLESRILGLDTLSDRTLEIVAYVIVGVVSSAFILAIPVVARRIRDAAPPSVEGTPLAAIAPWLG